MSMMRMRRATLSMMMAGCGPGAVKDVVGQPATPENPTAFKCEENKLHTKLSPCIIDWPGSLRGDIEMMMHNKNVAVVAFSCDEVKVLADCEVPGDYGFAGRVQHPRRSPRRPRSPSRSWRHPTRAA